MPILKLLGSAARPAHGHKALPEGEWRLKQTSVNRGEPLCNVRAVAADDSERFTPPPPNSLGRVGVNPQGRPRPLHSVTERLNFSHYYLITVMTAEQDMTIVLGGRRRAAEYGIGAGVTAPGPSEKSKRFPMTQAESSLEILVANEPVRKADRAREWGTLLVIVLVAGGLRLWRLDQNGYGNFYYAAAVRSMLESWSNFFFGSFDPAGFVTVDKPPVAIWIQAASAKLLGFRGVSLLLPEALMGTASVLLTYRLVRRVFGAAAGLLAGLILAITPICVAVDRDNLPDPALVFVLLLAAWALSTAAETGRLRPLLLSAALVGVGFNIKMLAAFVVLPTFYLCYLVAAPTNWRSRFVHLAAATMMVVAVSLSWSIAVELTPKSRRPYIGGSRNNSALDLALGYNGLGRVLGGSGNFRPGNPGRFPGAGPPATKDAPAAAKGKRKEDDAAKPKDEGDVKTEGSIPIRPETPSTVSPPVDVAKASPPTAPGEDPRPDGPGGGFPGGGPGGGFPGGGFPGGGPGGGFPGGGRGPGGFGGTPGLLRFTAPLMAGQITWLFPVAIIGGAVAAARAPRRRPVTPEQLALLLWAGWLGTHWIVFTFAQGIFHEYYTTIMGPAMAALAGIGVVALYDEWRQSEGHRGYLPTALFLTAAWQAYVINQFPEIRKYILPALGIGTVVSLIVLVTGEKGVVPLDQARHRPGLDGHPDRPRLLVLEHRDHTRGWHDARREPDGTNRGARHQQFNASHAAVRRGDASEMTS